MKNPEKALPNKHVFVIADSGGGKSYLLSSLIPKRKERTVLWDPNEDHDGVIACDTFSRFCKVLEQANNKSLKTGCGFRVAYTGEECPDTFERFCAVVCAILDGRFKTNIVIEELGGAAESTGKAKRHFRKLCNQARKYNAVIYANTQRPQETPKTAFAQLKKTYVGYFGLTADQKYISENTKISMEHLNDLDEFQFVYKDRVNPRSMPEKYKAK